MSEGYRKRRYPGTLSFQVTDADSENNETQVWLEFALACNHIEETTFESLIVEAEQIGRLLQHIIDNPGNYGAR